MGELKFNLIVMEMPTPALDRLDALRATCVAAGTNDPIAKATAPVSPYAMLLRWLPRPDERAATNDTPAA